MGLHNFERETCFGFDDSTHTCQCITFNRSLDKKLLGYCKKYPDQFKMIREQIYEDQIEGHEFTFPKNLITIRQPREKKMTDEQKKIASERMKKTQEKIKKERKKTEKSDV